MDPVQECSEVYISALRDTLPVTYEYDLLNDYLKPYFRINSFRVYHQGDLITYNGIQFRIIKLYSNNGDTILKNIIPENMYKIIYGRINGNTRIIITGSFTHLFFYGVNFRNPIPENNSFYIFYDLINYTESVLPRLIDLLPKEKIDIIRRTPICYRESLLNLYASELETTTIQRLYTNGEDGVGNGGSWIKLGTEERENIRRDLLKYYSEDCTSITSETTLYEPTPINYMLNCTVCRDLILNNTELIQFPCGHSFHKDCIGNWILINKSCPNCRLNILDSIQYLNTLSDNESVDEFDLHDTPMLLTCSEDTNSTNDGEQYFNILDY